MKWIFIVCAIGLIVFCFCACSVAKRSDEQANEMFQRFKEGKEE